MKPHCSCRMQGDGYENAHENLPARDLLESYREPGEPFQPVDLRNGAKALSALDLQRVMHHMYILLTIMSFASVMEESKS
jgi:hypothetical protein